MTSSRRAILHIQRLRRYLLRVQTSKTKLILLANCTSNVKVLKSSTIEKLLLGTTMDNGGQSQDVSAEQTHRLPPVNESEEDDPYLLSLNELLYSAASFHAIVKPGKRTTPFISIT